MNKQMVYVLINEQDDTDVYVIEAETVEVAFDRLYKLLVDEEEILEGYSRDQVADMYYTRGPIEVLR